MGADNETIFDLAFADIDEGKVQKEDKEREWGN